MINGNGAPGQDRKGDLGQGDKLSFPGYTSVDTEYSV